MPMNKAEDTRWRIIDAYLQAVKSSDFDSVTVRQICLNADIHRSTFYVYFTSVKDLHDRCEDELFEILHKAAEPLMKAIFSGKADLPINQARLALEPHFDRLGIMLNSLDGGLRRRMQRFARTTIKDIVGKANWSIEEELVISAIIGMQLSVITHWFITERSIEYDQVVYLLKSIFLQGPKATLDHMQMGNARS